MRSSKPQVSSSTNEEQQQLPRVCSFVVHQHGAEPRMRPNVDSSCNVWRLLMRKTLTVLAAVATLATAAVAVPSDAEAQWRGRGWGWGGPAVAAGVLGGLAAGAIVGG